MNEQSCTDSSIWRTFLIFRWREGLVWKGARVVFVIYVKVSVLTYGNAVVLSGAVTCWEVSCRVTGSSHDILRKVHYY
jgi:hypothetical protein